MDIEDKLSRLCELLQDGRLKSKQAAFDLSHEDLIEARRFFSWESISKVITEKTGEEYKTTIISNMFNRTRRKLGETTAPSEPIKQKETNTAKDTPPKEVTLSDDEHSAWHDAGFANDRIIKRLIDNQVPIDLAISWGAANDMQLSKKLTEFLLKKRK